MSLLPTSHSTTNMCIHTTILIEYLSYKKYNQYILFLGGTFSGTPSMIDIAAVKDIFLSVSAIRPCTEFLLTALAGDKEEQGPLQTQVLEINLRGGAPQVANAILSNKMFSHFDRPYIAKLCEAARLFQRALELFDDVADIKRVIVNTNEIPAEFITEYFRSLTQEDGLECLKELIQRADSVDGC